MHASPELQPLLDALDEPSLLVSSDRVVAANSAAEALLGPIAAGSDVRLAIPHPAALERILSGGRSDVEISGVGTAERPWLVSVRPFNERSVLVRLVDQSAARAAEKMRVDFVANASHELRTPLSTLVGYGETLREHGANIDEETQQRFVGIIHDEAKRMQRLVEDLISLSRIEGERFSPPRDRLEMRELVEEAAGNARSMADDRGAEIVLDLDGEVPATTGDRNQLLQLLDNLISNALRYGRSGAPVRVGIRREGEMVRLTVSDEGEGIPPEHIPRITERFYRVDKARSRESGGTGLGLSIVKHIVERHRGRLHIQSALGKGTDVHVLLPAASR